MVDLKTKQEFWSEQLPIFKEKYWIPDHLEVLEFDMNDGCFDITEGVKTDLSEEDLYDIYHRVNSGWAMWKKAVTFMKDQAQAVPEKKIYLTCEQLYAAANFGAPNKDPELLETELTIAWFEEAHSGSGYYVYISEYPEEGAMKLESESGAEG